MKMKTLIYIFILGALSVGCSPKLEIIHSPVVAKSSEQVTFTAMLENDGDGPCTVEMVVNGVVEKTCTNLSTGETCTFTGGPYTTLEDGEVSYYAAATDSAGETDERGPYYFSITNSNYNWKGLDYMWARYAGPTATKEDFVFHRVSDYTFIDEFIDHVENKMYGVFNQQEIIKNTDNFDAFNFYIYRRVASSDDCGTVNADADTDMPWRDVDAVLHATPMAGECANVGLRHFTADGYETQTFLHESGHAAFGLADEYDGETGYFQPADEPNIWENEADCRAEQTAKFRDPDECWQFASFDGGWWGIHDLNDNTVMQDGFAGDPWGVEAKEHVNWYFDQF